MAYSQERAVQYDDFIKAGAGPVHEQMLGSVAEALELTFQDRSLRILDMGTGTGSVAARILENHPNAKITCLDGSPDMLDQARKRLGADLRCDFVQRDFGEPSWWNGLGSFDAIVSVGAIHHLDAKGKEALFSKIHRQLRPGGLFLCADPLSGEHAFFDRLYEDAWVKMIQRNLYSSGREKADPEEIRRYIRKTQEAEGDQPSPLIHQLKWLSAAGFEEVECYWKSFGFAVFGGRKR
ncbi:MAG: hypothetical protein A3A86_05380 [Elusimicrobia bacterium RIFCSPLOWO2_01_FULL_60_11]|nr:MAG: hypothetical protein A3A86_05380 [Elusimicrobia bacterium RIFCSPLOWO2_01_FULL_60_11]